MTTRGVSVLKFVGTVSLGVLTGLSYTLSNLTIPTLLTLPSAETASKAFDSLTASAKKQVQLLGAVSGSAFALAFLFSPRNFRHPYLLYTSILVVASRFVTSDRFAPYLLNLGPAPASPSSSSSSSSPAAAKAKKQQKERAARARMEASYEVLGSDAHSEGTSSAEELEAEMVEEGGVNGEEVRARVSSFLKKQMVHTVVTGAGFLLAVVGIWGDGVVPVYGQTVVIKA